MLTFAFIIAVKLFSVINKTVIQLNVLFEQHLSPCALLSFWTSSLSVKEVDWPAVC